MQQPHADSNEADSSLPRHEATRCEPHVAAGWLAEHGDDLYRYAALRVGKREVAEDLVQETFLAAMTARESFRGESSERTWLISILRRKVVDYFRKISAARARGDSDRQEGGSSPEWFSAEGGWLETVGDWRTPPKIAENREFWLIVEECLSKLPRAVAGAFVMRELMGVETTELQRELSLTAGNLRTRLFRARQLLRSCLEKNWFGGQRD